MCKEFIRRLADDPGGIRWQYKLNKAISDIVDL